LQLPLAYAGALYADTALDEAACTRASP
jgi:hypothetical protein